MLQQEYQAIRAQAEQLAGDTSDIVSRAIVLHHLYEDSGGNHVFPLIATHGALWAYSYFEIGGVIGRLIARRYFYDPRERAYRLELLHQFAEGFREVNRLVCVDTFTNYHFTRKFGHVPEAEAYVAPALLMALRRVHTARETNRPLSPEERRNVFEHCFRLEQEITVAPGVEAAVNQFECRIMKFIALRPLVRFAYFPPGQALLFADFADREERIRKGLHALALAEKVGWSHVFTTLSDYALLPARFWESPERAFQQLIV